LRGYWWPSAVFKFYTQIFVSYNAQDYSRLQPSAEGLVQTNELYFTYIPVEDLVLEVGRKVLALGSGYIFNPTNISNFSQNIQDMSADKIGTTIYQMAWDIYPSTFSFTVIPAADVYDKNGAKNYDIFHNDNTETVNLLKWEGFGFGSDLDLSIAFPVNHASQLGVNWSRTFFGNWEAHVEAAVATGSDWLYPKVTVTASGDVYTFEKTKEYLQQPFWRVVVGGQYAWQENTDLIFEYYRNDCGFSPEDRDIFFRGVDGGGADLTQANQAYAIGRFGQNYLIAGILRRKWRDRFDLSATYLLNLDDTSSLLQGSIAYFGFEPVEVLLEASLPSGSGRSEFGLLPQEAEVRARVTFQI
jgi:hypothetical protein